MTQQDITTIECPNCGEQFDTVYWKSLNADIDSDAKESLLAGNFFSSTCSKCQSEHLLVYSMLYHDMTNKAMIQFVADENHIKNFINPTDDILLQMQTSMIQEGYKIRVVKNHNDLVEKAIIFNCGLDDRVVEYLKLLYQTTISQKNPNLINIHTRFCYDDSYKFIVFLNDVIICTINIDMEMYAQIAKDIYHEINEKSKDCFFINQEWARSLL